MSRSWIILIALAVAAQQQGPAPRVGVSAAELHLSLAEAVEMALKNNLELEIERTSVANAAQSVIAARGYYDPRFMWKPFLESRAVPVANTLAAPQGKLNEHYLNQDFSFVQPTQWQGLSVRVDFLNSRQSTSNPFTGLSPFWQTGLSVSITQPLLRGRVTDLTRTEIIVRQKQATLASNDLELRVIDVVTRAQTAYWDLAAALQDVRVEQDGVKLAEEQLARNQRMIASGTLAPVELAASEAELQRRLDGYITATGMVTIAENSLKSLLSSNRAGEIWGQQLIPTERGQVKPGVDALPAAIQLALARRPEIRSLDIQDQINGTRSVQAKDQIKPQVNLVASYNNAGLAGTLLKFQNPIASVTAAQVQRLNDLSAIAGLPPLPTIEFGGIPPSLVGGYGSSISNLFSGNYQTVQAGVQVDWTIRNRTAEAQLAQTAIAERRLKLQRQVALQGIEVDVRNALQGVETARQRLQAAQAAERAAREKLDSEVRLFQTGESTNFLVLVRQNEVLDARRRTVQAMLLNNKAAAVLARATGGTLEENKITLR